MSSESIRLRRVVVSALFLAAALMLRQFFAFYIPLFGVGGMRVGVSGIFSIPPSILFGPLYGALVTGLLDVIGHFLRPVGPYLPQMTIVMASGGFLRGVLWLSLRNRCVLRLRVAAGAFAALMIIFSVSTIIMLRVDGITPSFFEGVEEPALVETAGMTVMGRFIVTRSQTATNPPQMLADRLVDITTVPLAVGGFALALLIIDILVSKRVLRPKEDGTPASIMPLLLAIVISGLYMNTLNTVILRQHVFLSWQLMPFVVVWLPRAVQAALTTTVYAYIVAVIMEVVSRQKFMQQIIRKEGMNWRFWKKHPQDA